MALEGPDGLVFILTDHLGSVVALADESGDLVADSQQRYLPFGQPRLAADSPTDFTFTGQRALDAVGLMDYNARFYDTGLGIFIQPDRLITNVWNAQNLNRFSYVQNNPVVFIDPSGNSRQKSPKCDGPHDRSCSRDELGGKSYNDMIRIDLEDYIGPIHEPVFNQLVKQGADPDLLNLVTIHIKQDNEWKLHCGFNDNFLAVTWGNTVYICRLVYGGETIYSQYQPTPVLIHELLHVAQNNQYPEEAFKANAESTYWQIIDSIYAWANEHSDTPIPHLDHNPYETYDECLQRGAGICTGIWTEVQGHICEDAFRADPTIPLDMPPCNLSPFQ